MTLNPVLAIVNTALNGQGRPNGSDQLWFYNAAFAYKLTTFVGYQLDSYNRFNKRWATLIWRGTEDQIVRDLPLYGPFLPLDQIDTIWGDVFTPHPTHQLDPLLAVVNTKVANGVPSGTTELWYYNKSFAYKVTNCSQKYCVNRVVRIANDIFGEWIPQVESGDLEAVLKALGEGEPFLSAEEAKPLWSKLQGTMTI
jgi:hypothetical protein